MKNERKNEKGKEGKREEYREEVVVKSSRGCVQLGWAGARDVWAWDVREAWTWNRGEEECQMGMLQNEATQPIPSSLPFFPRSLWLPVAPPPLPPSPSRKKRLGPSVFGASLLRVFSLALFLTNPAARLALLYPNRETL